MLALMRGRQDTVKYIKVLEEHLLPFTEEIMPILWTFQQDNCSIHVSNKAKSWFNEQGIRVMTWPSRSPDLNPIENLWGILARDVYGGNRQFQSERELLNCVINCWKNIEAKVLEKLVQTMHNRCVAVIENQGGNTKY